MTDTLLPIGTAVTILADTFGEHAVTATIAGYVAYSYPHDTNGRMEQGYALHLDHGFFAPVADIPVGSRPWVGTIVAHVESVEPA